MPSLQSHRLSPNRRTCCISCPQRHTYNCGVRHQMVEWLKFLVVAQICLSAWQWLFVHWLQVTITIPQQERQRSRSHRRREAWHWFSGLSFSGPQRCPCHLPWLFCKLYCCSSSRGWRPFACSHCCKFIIVDIHCKDSADIMANKNGELQPISILGQHKIFLTTFRVTVPPGRVW